MFTDNAKRWGPFVRERTPEGDLKFEMRLRGVAVVQAYLWRGGAWVRVFGYGIGVRDMVKHPPLFSERKKGARVLHFRNWMVKLLDRGYA